MISGGWPPDCKAGGCGYREKNWEDKVATFVITFAKG